MSTAMTHQTPREKAVTVFAAIIAIITGVLAIYTFVSGNKDLPEAISGGGEHVVGDAIVKEAIADRTDASTEVEEEEDGTDPAENGAIPAIEKFRPPDSPWCLVVLEEWPDDIDCAKAAFKSTAGACNVPLSAMPSMYRACTSEDEIEGKCTRITAVPFHEGETTTSAVVIASWCEQLRNQNVHG